MADFSQAKIWIEAYCAEDGVSPAKTKKLVAAVSDLKKLSRLGHIELFMLWDALGFCDERNSVTETIYKFLKLHMKAKK